MGKRIPSLEATNFAAFLANGGEMVIDGENYSEANKISPLSFISSLLEYLVKNDATTQSVFAEYGLPVAVITLKAVGQTAGVMPVLDTKIGSGDITFASGSYDSADGMVTLKKTDGSDISLSDYQVISSPSFGSIETGTSSPTTAVLVQDNISWSGNKLRLRTLSGNVSEDDQKLHKFVGDVTISIYKK